MLWGGEVGRTPRSRRRERRRDHNPEGFPWDGRGGCKPGFRYGATDDYGWYAENPVHVPRLHATILARWPRPRAFDVQARRRDFRLPTVGYRGEGTVR